MSVNMKFNSLMVTIVWPIQGLEVHYKTHYPDKNENVPIVIYYLLDIPIDRVPTSDQFVV